ncbi:MAG: class I SAM-dependent DNA methyltransferase, partial [Microcystaceae cyanobacterium]
TGAFLEDRPNYNHSDCFMKFPFPAPSETLKQQIRDLGERLDNHRKTVQANHPDITLTGMYNLLEKMRKGEPFSEPDQAYNNRALVSILKQIHDELDTAVFTAYGWPQTLTDSEILERLVALNLERAEEEKNGLIRWLRPDYQAPEQVTAQPEIEGIEIEETLPTTAREIPPFPSTIKEQLSVIRELLRADKREWTIKQIEEQFSGKKKPEAIANCLEILEELGLIISNKENGKKTYYAAELTG